MATTSNSAGESLSKLADIMARLRDPNGGCPWDLEQDFSTIAPYTIEEAYEVLDAINRGSMPDLKEELGDLLFQTVFHSQMAAEQGAFNLKDVVDGICEKMIRRHPHVFEHGDDRSSQEQTIAWEEMKAKERALKGRAAEKESALDGVADALPALLRAEKLQKRAARTGFDWTDAEQIFDKLDEETLEVREAIESKNQAAIEDEIGDLLFVVANLSRRLAVDPEIALRNANDKFERRFKGMEKICIDQGIEFNKLTLEEQEACWQTIKQLEKTSD